MQLDVVLLSKCMLTQRKPPPYHCQITPLRRHEGARMAHWIAYVSGLNVKHVATGETHSRRGGDVVSCARYGAEKIPLDELAAKVERAEKREKAVIGRRAEFALPSGLSDMEAIDMVEAFAWFIFCLVRAPVMFAVHRQAGSDNLHGHLIIFPRVWDDMRRQFGAKVRALDVRWTGGQMISKIRGELARLINAKLPASMAVQAAARPGEPRRRHLGPAMHRLEHAGVKTAHGDYNRLVDEYEAIDRELTLLKRRRMEMEQLEVTRPVPAPGSSRPATKALSPNGPTHRAPDVAQDAHVAVPAVSRPAEAKPSPSHDRGYPPGAEKPKTAAPVRQPAVAEPAVPDQGRGVAPDAQRTVRSDARPSPVRSPTPALGAAEVEDVLTPTGPGSGGLRRAPKIQLPNSPDTPAA